VPFSDRRRARVRELEQLEGALMWDASYVPQYLDPAEEAALRYAFALARVTAVPVGDDVVDIGYATDRFRNVLYDLLAPVCESATYPESPVGDLIPELRRVTRQERTALLELFGPRLPEPALEAALRKRCFGLALGGGGGVAYVFLGAFALMHEAGLAPDLIAGTSMGAILGSFRALGSEYNPAMVRAVVESLSWRNLFRVFDVESRYGLPAALKLFLHEGIQGFFVPDGRAMQIRDLEIQLRIVVAGIAAAHLGDVSRFDKLFDGSEKGLRLRFHVERIARAIADIASKPLKSITLGGDDLTSAFDLVDALGFSGAVPGIIHYDILRDDPRMVELVEQLLEREGAARLVDGGLVDNVPARVAWDAIQEGAVPGRRDPFVLALDAFAPRIAFGQNLLFLPLMRLAAETSKVGYAVAHHTVSFRDVPSPLAVVPSSAQVDKAIATGRAQFEKHLPFIQKMLSPIPLGEGIVDTE